jgi:putative transcriptional regulator
MLDSLRGRLLVASPALIDPNFDRAVIFVLEHNDEGALGVVLNRPSELPVRGMLDTWAHLAAEPALMFVGGPVAANAVIAVAQADLSGVDEQWTSLTDDLGTVDLESPPELSPWVRRVRMFAGYAGWGPGQLDAEVDDQGWYPLDLEPGDPFTANPGELWWEVLARQGGELGRLRNYPHDLSDN